ncbi:response regulator transcription factor [Actinomadura atramentaria]|uniref:response regulator transcription factor n=1 Tax=Actinomadura atramentaria TaxID=1990 RepID=UPI000375743A|nr:response regulator transcription factor [Actinomadura atramentaria]
MARLLVVEDDETIGGLLDARLRAQGHEVAWVRTGRAALRAAASDVDLVLLDLGLPDLDGVEVCRQIRGAQPGCVLVILTARQDDMDVVVGLEAGADDYLTKPFGLAVLLARVRAHLRRGAPAAPRPRFEVGDLVLDTAARTCDVADRDLGLRPKEFDLLARLVAEPDTAVSRERLMDDVWDANWSGSTKTLDVHVAAVRGRLAEAARAEGVRVPRIVTLRGHGYRLESP